MTPRNTLATTLSLSMAVALAACSPGADNTTTTSTTTTIDNVAVANETTTNTGSAAGSAVAELKTADGKAVGTATATEVAGAVQVAVDGTGMPPGVHGAHVHTVGKCEGPKFESAGGHWNPAGKQHGTENPQGPHAGDFPNLTVKDDGAGALTMKLPAGTMAGLLDADGAAFVIHAKPDDNKTDPSGNSGDRIACGVFAAT